MSGNTTEQHEYSTSASEVEKKLKQAKTRATVLTMTIFLIIASIFFFVQWKNANDIDYIEGNVLKIARSGSASTGIVWKSSSFVGQLAWSGLLGTDATFTEIKPELADSIDVTPDGLTYTIVMKDGLKWSDGHDLTVNDVIFSIESALLCPSTGNVINSSLQQIKGAEEWKAVGVESWENGNTHSLEGLSAQGNTLTITLDNPYSSFPMAMTQFVILPQHILKDVDPSTITEGTDEMTQFYAKPVSSGMYMVECTNDDGDLELIHNPHYYGEHSDIERVILYGAYQTMYIDYHNTSSTTDMVSYRNMSGFDEYLVNVQFYRYFVFNLMGGYEMVPALDEEGNEILDEDGEVVLVASYEEGEDREENYPMQNYLLRQAISLAIDREMIASDVYLGNARHDFALTGNEAYISFLTDHNITKAKALLAESGYDMERPIRIHHYHTDSNSVALLTKVKQSLEEIGLTVIVEKTAGVVAMYTDREYDILLKGYAAQSPSEWYIEYPSTATSVSDLLGTSEFDNLILQLEGAANMDEYNKVLAELQELDRSTMYKMPIVTSNDCTYINANRIFVPDDMEFGNVRYRSDLRLNEWYVKKA